MEKKKYMQPALRILLSQTETVMGITTSGGSVETTSAGTMNASEARSRESIWGGFDE